MKKSTGRCWSVAKSSFSFYKQMVAVKVLTNLANTRLLTPSVLLVAAWMLILALTPTAALGQTSSITLAWPSPSVVMLTGVEVGVYGQIQGSTTGVTPLLAIENSASGQWLHADGSWGAQAWLTASIVDTAGTWRYMLTPNATGNFLLDVELVNTSGAILSTAQTTFQVAGNSSSQPSQSTSSSGSGSSTSITLAWPTPGVVMMPGVQVGMWGVATASSSAQVSVAIENNQSGQWLNANGSWGAQTWLSAPIVDSAGTWRYLYTPASGGSFTVVAQVVNGSVTQQASSTFTVQGGSASGSTSSSGSGQSSSSGSSTAGTFPLSVINNTNGQWTNSQIWLTIIGQSTPGTWAYVTPDGVVHPVNSAQASAPGAITCNGVNYAPMSFLLPASGQVTMPASLQGGRVYISLGAPLCLAVPQNNSGIALPDVNNPSDPNANTYWDYYEYTYVFGRVAFGGDTSQVDEFGFPISARVQQASSSTDSSTGFLVSRQAILNHFLNDSDPGYQQLVNSYHVLAPRTSTAFSSSSASQAMQSYINAVWQQYASSPFTLTVLGQTYSGGVQSDGALHFSLQGTSGYVVQEPAAADVWGCSGALATGNAVELALEAEFCAAFTRGVAGNTSEWWERSQYYQGPAYSQYAGYLHSVALGGRTYAFPYDDVNDQSSVIILPNTAPPDRVTLTLNW